MSNDTVVSLAAPARVSDPLTELLRTGARRLIEAAVTAEFEEYLSAFVQEQLGELIASFSHWLVRSQDPIHRTLRAQVPPFVQKGRDDLGR